MLAEFSENINAKFSFLKERKLLLAVSGGIDSVVLAYLLNELKLDFGMAHCNFQLRGEESDADEAFVKKLSDNFNVPFFSKRFNTKNYATKRKLSIQLAARSLRYEWFEELLKTSDFEYLLTAHQANDNIETFLINVTRGTGLDGLTGIPEQNNYIIRPLLFFNREQIYAYAMQNNITWREDSSNIETKYFRNKIRHKVIPILKELNPSLVTSFNKTFENLKASKQIIDTSINEIKERVVSRLEDNAFKLDINKLKELNNPKAYLFELLKEYGFTEWNDVENLLKVQPGKQLFSKTHRLIKDREFLLLTEIEKNNSKNEFSIQKNEKLVAVDTFKLSLQELKKEEINVRSDVKNAVYLDKDLLKFPLIVRKWSEGDYFYPFGMKGKKKLSKFFKDEKLSLFDKEKIRLLCSGNDIVWVIGLRPDDRFKITNQTKKILKIELQ